MESLLAATGKRSGYWRIQAPLHVELPEPRRRGMTDPASLTALAERLVRDEQQTLAEVSEALAG